MAHAYTPGLKRKEATIVRKTRRLPIKGEVLVKKGQEVSPDDIVAVAEIPGESKVVNVARLLNVEPDEIRDFLLKKEGDKVSKGEIIAGYKAFFGLFKSECVAPTDGIIEHISDVTGQVVIREPPVKIEVNAYIPGEVVDVLPGEGAIIETAAAFIQGIFGIGGERRGEIKLAVNSPKEILTSEKIDSDADGKVLIGGSLVTYDGIQKAIEVGARGIVVGGIEDRDLRKWLGYEIGVAITGHEDVPLTLIVTEGFGKMNMSDRTFEILKKFEGMEASISGATQIRAGVVRPEIIVPRSDLDVNELRSIESGETEFSQGMDIGTLVRIIRKPYFGAIGRVVSLPVEPQLIETGSKVRVVEVELEDGRRVTVPRANVEIIEE